MALPSERLAGLVEKAGTHADDIRKTGATATAKGGERGGAAASEPGGAMDVWSHTAAGAAAASEERPAETWEAAADSPSREWARADSDAVGTSMAAQAAEAQKQFDILTGQREPDPGQKGPQGALGHVGATFELLTSLEQTISAPLAMLPFPAFPALRVMDMDIGLPHGHTHPPNLVPPAPMVFLPSTGPIIPIPFLSGATRTLINGLPAGRCGDMGLGVWCGGYFPMYEVFLGSSSVWIEGARAGRLLVDVTRHCMFSAPRPSDPPLGPMVGMTITASPNVLVGGVPMPSLLDLAMGAAMEALFKGIAKVAKKAKELRAQRLADGVDDAMSRAAPTPYWLTRPTSGDYWADLLDAKFIKSTDPLDRANEAFQIASEAEAFVLQMFSRGRLKLGKMDGEILRMVREDLIQVASNPVGRKTLERIDASGKTVTIRAGRGEIFGAKGLDAPDNYWDEVADAPGKGSDSRVHYDPSVRLSRETTPDSALHHELVHAANNGEGVNRARSTARPEKVGLWERIKTGQKTRPGEVPPDPDPSTARPGTTHEERVTEATERWSNLEEQKVIREHCNPYRDQYNKNPRWGHKNLSTTPSP